MSRGDDIAAEVAAALAEASAEVGDGPLYCTLRRASGEPDEPATPWDPDASPENPPKLTTVIGLEEMSNTRDESGTLVGVVRRYITVSATETQPLKSDTIAIGVRDTEVTSSTTFEEILGVKPLSPGGVPVLFELELSI